MYCDRGVIFEGILEVFQSGVSLFENISRCRLGEKYEKGKEKKEDNVWENGKKARGKGEIEVERVN